VFGRYRREGKPEEAVVASFFFFATRMTETFLADPIAWPSRADLDPWRQRGRLRAPQDQRRHNRPGVWDSHPRLLTNLTVAVVSCR